MKQQILVIGLGRFGASVARELDALGHEVMAVDSSERIVNGIAPHVTHALQLDASDEGALRAAGAGEFPHAIVSISSATDASIFAVMALKNLGVPNVIAKAANNLHAAILERVGASRVVLPEREAGEQLAHTFAIPHVIDYLDLGPRFGIAKVRPPAGWAGRTLAQLDLPLAMKLTPIALVRGEKVTVNPHGSEVVGETDTIVLVGLDERLEQVRDEPTGG
jgi:trk system potassium uptake protein TrkA